MFNKGLNMASARPDDEKSGTSDFLTVYVWGGNDGGHASMAVNSEKGKNYLSFWPKTAPINRDLSVPRDSLINDYNKDCLAEARKDQEFREPEGVYILGITNTQANSIFSSIEEIKNKVKNQELKYIFLNQYSDDGKPTENYNCSGMVEKTISENLSIQFGPPADSTPQRIVSKMIETPGVKIVTHDEKELGVSLPLQTTAESNADISQPTQSRL